MAHDEDKGWAVIIMVKKTMVPTSQRTRYFFCAKKNRQCRLDNYVVGSKSFRPDIQKPRQMENAMRDI